MSKDKILKMLLMQLQFILSPILRQQSALASIYFVYMRIVYGEVECNALRRKKDRRKMTSPKRRENAP
jgi:hypothetical protein